MSINDLKINITTASILYQEGLTVVAQKTNAIIPNNSIANKNQGSKNIVIICNAEITQTYTEWFEKVFNYCKLEIDNTIILPYDPTKNIDHIQDNFHPQQLWVFGVNYKNLNIHNLKTLHFEIMDYNNIRLLALPRIETFFDIQIMKEHKLAFMYCLKKLFAL